MIPADALFADVAVALPVRSLYTYRVPEAMRGDLPVGAIVRVPVRNRAVEGVVARLSSETTTPLSRLKNITARLTPDYAITPDLMDLARWMTEYYMAGPGETLSAVSFFGLGDQRERTERRLTLSDAGLSRSGEDAPRLTPLQEKVVKALMEECNAPLTRAELRRRVGCSASVIDGLLKKGILQDHVHTLAAPEDEVHAGDPVSPHALSGEQQEAFDRVRQAIDEERFEAFLLYGVTGSGKTEVYLRAIARALDLGRQAIVLVPEISLTPQAVERFRGRFGSRVGVYHSQLTRAQKYALWRRIASGAVQVLIGARSAIFAPFERLGLIVVDEEHEHSYKQGDPAPRYHARDVALVRARSAGAPALLGSATPSLESLLNARPVGDRGGKGKFTLLSLTERAGEAVMPDVRLVDMGSHVREDRQTSQVSTPLQNAIAYRLERGEQSILFLNRRGFSNFLLCLPCKTAIRCDHCDVVLTWHKAIGRLMCHFCGATRARPTECPECGAPEPAAMGAGTQRIEEEMAELFPKARLLRIDLDTTRGRDGFLRQWEKMDQADILLGTQMIAKGLHLERVTLVGVISADHALFLPDFRSAERAFALLTQVAGRAGRMSRKGEVIVQTFVPHHYAVQRAVIHDSEGFWSQELHMREVLRFPPFQRLLLARLSGLEPERVIRRAERLGQLVRECLDKNVAYRGLALLGPTPCPIGRIQNKTRWQLVIRGERPAGMRGLLLDALAVFDKDKDRKGVSLTIDMDPMDLL